MTTTIFIGTNTRELELVRSRLRGGSLLHVRTSLELIWLLQREPADTCVVIGVSCPHALATALRGFLRQSMPKVRFVDAYAAARRPTTMPPLRMGERAP